MDNTLYNSRAWHMLVARYGEGEAHAIVYYVMEVVFHIKKTDFLAEGLECLTPELLAAETREGVMTPQELPRWQRMFAAAEEAVENYYGGEETRG